MRKRIKELAQLSSTPIPKSLMVGLAIVLGTYVCGFVLLYVDKEAFHAYTQEDHFVEWLQVVVIVIMSAYSFAMSHAFSRTERGRAAKRLWLFLGFLLIFGIMEEISWGQRILGIESPEWFLKHNRQGETNVHNLVIYGVNINKLVFGTILGGLMGVYLVVVPLLHRFNARFKNFINRWGVPVAQNYQIILFIANSIIVELHRSLSGKVGELFEFCNYFTCLLILMHPYNKESFPLKGLAFWRRKGR